MTAALRSREAILALVVTVMLGLVALRAPGYLAFSNVTNLLSNWGFLLILVLGQLGVLLTRGIDLSQASILAFSGMFLALLSQVAPDLPSGAFVVLAMAMGIGLGLVNAGLIVFAGLPPIIATLGTMTVIRGLIFVLSDGAWISSHEMSAPFKAFPAGAALGIPNVFLVALAATFFVWILLTQRRIGRDIYAYGGNPEAARNAGVSGRRVEFLVYGLSGALAGLCGYLWAGRYAIAYTQSAEGREFAIIAACVIGGASITGGRGTVAGVVLGALFIAILETALPFLRINPFLQLALTGAVILLAVAANARAEWLPGRQILPREDRT
ncbi:ABC transporter permease [Jannaschia sp. M317]|uniref:ABC transporter permease n=1 Tax=Jannaschia sp. M317 TaxID=2867011 RepID=UPI0021A3EE3E|nr:ABC transporter permease [Jannaschia sp. M317]UWQ17453.1 ABC transporter permease [Jannaschia sp. M317]